MFWAAARVCTGESGRQAAGGRPFFIVSTWPGHRLSADFCASLCCLCEHPACAQPVQGSDDSPIIIYRLYGQGTGIGWLLVLVTGYAPNQFRN